MHKYKDLIHAILEITVISIGFHLMLMLGFVLVLDPDIWFQCNVHKAVALFVALFAGTVMTVSTVLLKLCDYLQRGRKK